MESNITLYYFIFNKPFSANKHVNRRSIYRHAFVVYFPFKYTCYAIPGNKHNLPINVSEYQLT